VKHLLLGAMAAIATPIAAMPTPIRIAFTMDDLPVHGPLPPGETRTDVAQHVIAALRDARLPPTWGFVNAAQVEREPGSAPVLDLWREAGFPLGNHTWSHADLDTVGVAAFEREIATNEATLVGKMGKQDWHWLRFPYLHEGENPAVRQEVRAYLASHGYRIAAVTMSFGDYLWNAAYARCVAARDGQAIATLERTYLAAAEEALPTDGAAHPPYVLLMHIGAFDAHMLPQLLALYRHYGVRFVSLEEAERDPAYAADVDPKLPPRPSRPKAVPRTDYASILDALCPPVPSPLNP
jgi:peptidoglycan/xylan/chitin deacetylase (PgdA/CDA1 family)